MLHGCESLAPNIVELKRLCCNDQAMIRCICGTSHKEVIPSATLLQKLEILDITKVLQIWHLIMVWARDAFTTNDKHNKILQVWQSLVTENIENQRRAGLNVLRKIFFLLMCVTCWMLTPSTEPLGELASDVSSCYQP